MTKPIWLAACLASTLWLAFTVPVSAADSPLADAARRQDTDAVRKMLDERADVNAAHIDGTTALHWMVYHDDVDTAKALIAAGADVNAKNRYGVSPLSLACKEMKEDELFGIERIGVSGRKP